MSAPTLAEMAYALRQSLDLLRDDDCCPGNGGDIAVVVFENAAIVLARYDAAMAAEQAAIEAGELCAGCGLPGTACDCPDETGF